MMNVKTQEAIVNNILEFDERERKRFIKYLVDICVRYNGTDIIGEDDLIDGINIKSVSDYWELDTVGRERYMDAFLKMHTERGNR